MLKSLENKVIVITGSSRGIGLAIATACAGAGASVILSARDGGCLSSRVGELRREGRSVEGFAADVTRAGDIESLFERSLAVFGKIDVWINNAGISGGYRTLQSMSPGDIDGVISTNVMGTFYACRLLIPYFLSVGGGSIINIAGRGGGGKASPFQAPYGASKAAVVSLTRSLAAENKGKTLSINCLSPGMVETDIYRDVITCPETENMIGVMPVLLRAFATPMSRVQQVALEMCALKPGSVSGKCFSAERPERYLRALRALPDLIKARKSRS